MQAVARTFCFALLIFQGCLGRAEELTDSAEAFLEEWAKAWESNSVDKLASYYEESKELIAIDSLGRSHMGLAGVREMYAAAFGEADWQNVRVDRITLRAEGNFAWGVCRCRGDLTLKVDQQKLSFTSRGSFVLRRDGEHWRIAMEHFSPLAGEQRVQLQKH
jgi:ketosteroid isomerase-like protein